MGQSPKSENYTDNPNDHILVQGNADMKNGRVLPRVWTTQVTKRAEKNDLILSVRAPVGDVGKTDYNVVLGRGVAGIKGNEFIFHLLTRMKENGYWTNLSTGSTFESINSTDIKEAYILIPNNEEQIKIGEYFNNLDNLITLHQRMLFMTYWRDSYEDNKRRRFVFQFYEQWVKVYKEGAVREVTMAKYRMTIKWLKELMPTLKVYELNRTTYQQLLNEYALSHEKQTTMDFHHQLKGAILDAVDDGLIDRDPTRKAIIKGRTPKKKKPKFLNQFELNTLIKNLDLDDSINWDWLILLMAKTGMRFSEALGLTPSDFDFSYQTVSVNKTWDYKGKGGFLPTKNKSSVRKIQIDWQTTSQFVRLVEGMNEGEPIFVKGKVYNSTINNILGRHCKDLEIPIISIHGLRHTHASLLLFAGVSMASVARRLGHSSMTTTQKTYLHIIHELENQDTDLIIRSISQLV